MTQVLKEPGDVADTPYNSALGRWSSALVLIVLAGLLILAHGCHGDEDTELFAPRTFASE